jgi:hypothetical protein
MGEYSVCLSLRNQLMDARDDKGSEVNQAAVRLANFSLVHLEEIIPDIALEFVLEECIRDQE